jgi:hypothetical protein
VRDALLTAQNKTFPLGVELPEAFRVGGDLQDVAGMPAGHDSIADWRRPFASWAGFPDMKFEI